MRNVAREHAQQPVADSAVEPRVGEEDDLAVALRAKLVVPDPELVVVDLAVRHDKAVLILTNPGP